MASRTDVKISVIVPVYNVEKELPRCIESLLTQTYSPFACSSPLLRAEDTPPFFLCRVRMRRSFSAYFSMISGLPSDEPSFIRSSSKFEGEVHHPE